MKSRSIAIFVALIIVPCLTGLTKAYSAECYKIKSIDKASPNLALRYVEQTDSTSRIYAVLTMPEESGEAFLVNVPRSVLVSDGDMDYKLLHAHNIPVLDESMLEFSILEDNDRKLNFILEFEKFPIDEKLDLVDKSSDDSPLNLRGICVDATETKNVDSKRFMASTALPRCGRYYEEGASYTYYLRDGVFVSCHSSYGSKHFTLYISIVNNSDHGILFNTRNLTIKGDKPKGKGSVEVDLPLFSKNDYTSLLEDEDSYMADKASHSAGLSEIGSAVSFASIGVPWRSLEHTGLNVLGGFLRDISTNAAKPYLAELDKTRAERTKNYLQSQSIKPGESHSGFLRVEKPKQVKNFRLTIHMDGYDFEFGDRIYGDNEK